MPKLPTMCDCEKLDGNTKLALITLLPILCICENLDLRSCLQKHKCQNCVEKSLFLICIGVEICFLLMFSEECGDPGGLHHGVRSESYWPYLVNTQISYTCHPCYHGGGTITCQSDGEWTHRPQCQGYTGFPKRNQISSNHCILTRV